MQTRDQTDQTEWAEFRGIARVVLVWLVMLAVSIGLLFVLRATVF